MAFTKLFFTQFFMLHPNKSNLNAKRLVYVRPRAVSFHSVVNCKKGSSSFSATEPQLFFFLTSANATGKNVITKK